MTDVIMIPLSKLIECEDNVRRSNRKGGIAELSASIHSHGLLQQLLVREADKGKFAVIAGGRRLRALRHLAKAKLIDNKAPVPCRVVSGDNGTELSLAENSNRRDTPPADEIVAFSMLAESGEGPEAIAARFGVSPIYVARRLKLARVSPRLIEALRKDEINLDQLAALAFTDDHTAQEAAFFDGPEWARTPERLKAQVTQAHVPETDKLARFVGIGAYQAEGGAIVSDLFGATDDDSTNWLADRDLLTRLAEAKLTPIADEIRGEGWAWVEIAIDGVAWTQFPERVRERRRELSAEEAAEQERLYATLDETEDEAEIEKIEATIDTLASSGWAPDEVALAGAIITLTHDGAPKIERGLVRADDVKALKALRRKLAKPDDQDVEDNGAGVAAPAPRLRIPAKLVDELLAHKTLALRAELGVRPDLALRLLVFTLACDAIEPPWRKPSCLDVRVEDIDVSRSIVRCESRAIETCNAELESWKSILPSDPEALWAFTHGDQETLLKLLAILIAPGIDLRTAPSSDQSSFRIGDVMAAAIELDMSAWWSATPESLFEHVRKDVIVDAMIEVKPTLDRAKLDKMSKAELVSRAKRIFKGSSWLPEPLRTHSSPVATVTAIAAE